MVKVAGLIILLAMSAEAATNLDLHYRPGKAAATVTRDLNSISSVEVESSIAEGVELERQNLKKRIEWLETLNNYVYYKKNGGKVFPYDIKIKALKTRLKELEANATSKKLM